MDKLKNFLLDLLFPKFCFGCNKEGVYFCDDCRATVDISEFQYCLCDRNPVRLGPEQKDNGKCDRCRHKELSGLYFALAYKEKFLVKKLIHQFKYQPYIKDLAKTLAGLLVEHFVISGKNTDEIWENAVLIPAPIHMKKLRERGYNQAEELAKELAKVLQIPVISDYLIKIKSTRPQMELSKEQREKNLSGAFALNKNCSSSGLEQFSKVYLVDDVYTTGSTMQECAKILCEAGAKSVWGICLAREE